MTPTTGPSATADIEADFWRELAEIETESMGWVPLGEGCYLHTGTDPTEVLIVGSANIGMADSHVLWFY
jgi:prepilin-type processing-associated H-X9-DG protein